MVLEFLKTNKTGPQKSPSFIGFEKGTIWLFVCYIAMEKDPPFLSSLNHLFRLGPSIPWRTVSHNQMVNIPAPWFATMGLP